MRDACVALSKRFGRIVFSSAIDAMRFNGIDAHVPMVEIENLVGHSYAVCAGLTKKQQAELEILT